VMAMDYGTPQADMVKDAEDAVTATARQVAAAYQNAGEPLATSAVWSHLGVTVMIGVNDSPGEVFSTRDATALTSFASAHRIGRVSLWSLNRDAACTSATFTGAVVHSNTCSGVRQATTGEFSRLMARLSPSSAATDDISSAAPAADSADPTGTKDPANSPYPAWRSWPVYDQGYRVEQDGNIYEAKWQNSGADPVAETGANPTPWQLLGPVLPSDHAPRITKLVSGHYAQWSPARHYQTGAIVDFQGLPYAAQWFTVGTSPAAASLGANACPWLPLFDVEGEPSATASGTFALEGLS
jgi:chitinase